MTKLYLGKPNTPNMDYYFNLFEERVRSDGSIFFRIIKGGNLEELAKEAAKKIWRDIDITDTSYPDKYFSGVHTEFNNITLYGLGTSHRIIKEMVPIGKEDKEKFYNFLGYRLNKYIHELPKVILDIPEK